jgi:hypothetical protein
MTDKRQNELQDLLKEGISALREMRKGMENACVELRTLFGETLRQDIQKVAQRSKGKAYGKRKTTEPASPIINSY